MKRRIVEPGNIYDWATRAAEHIDPKASVARIAAVIATFAKPLVALLRESKRKHHHDMIADCCPQCDCGTDDGSPNDEDAPCTCGADAWNARIERALNGASR